MKNYLGKWPIHFSILLVLRIGRDSAPNARPARAFRFSGAHCNSGSGPRAPPPQRPEQRINLLHMCTTFTTYVYEIYYICVRNLLQRSVRHSSGPRSLRQRPYRPSSEVGCCMSRLRGVPKVGAPACQAPGELKGTRSEAKTASNTPLPPPPSPPPNTYSSSQSG